MKIKFYRAASDGDVAFLKTAAEEVLSDLTPKKNSILHIAAEAGNLEFLKEVITALFPPARRVLLYQKNSDGDTALHLAVRMGHPQVVDFIIEQARTPCPVDYQVPENFQSDEKPLQLVNMNGDSLLHLAARHGHRQVAESLIKADSTLLFNFVNTANESPFFVAVENLNHDVAALIFTSLPAPCSQLLEAADIGKTTVLHALCSTYFKALRASQEHSSSGNVDQRNSSCSTPEDWYNLMKQVMEKVPDLANQGDSRDWTPLHYAADLGITQVVELLLQKEYPSTAYLVNNNGESPLHIAASRGNVAAMEVLIEACPDCWDIHDKKGRTALHSAVVGVQKGSVKFILDFKGFEGLSVNEADEDGNTATHLAALNKDDEIFYILLENKRTYFLAFKNKESSTAFDIKRRQILDEKETLPKQEHHNKDEEKEGIEDKYKGVTADDVFGSYVELGGVLVATIAFAAPFSMPGGFIQSGSPNEGMAFVSSKAFNAFVIFDILAFFLSSCPVFLRFMKVNISMGSFYNVGSAYMAALLAFTCGLYSILDGGLRTASLIISLLFMTVIPWISSCASAFTTLKENNGEMPVPVSLMVQISPTARLLYGR